ncbi:MAG TPA: nuclear transport factor 2 family protein [Patescibacteria group bacterium]|nr:nuclear transport factor 2 family protein [Patescibacteria group bacterium]
MTTKETIEMYLDAIHKGDWESYVADDFVFVNNNLDKAAHGKAAYLEGAGRFFKATTAVKVDRMVIDGDNVALVARYDLRSPKGAAGVCDVAEFITVKDDKLTSSAIFFDTKAFAEFMARG